MNCTICLGPCTAVSPHRVGHIRQELIRDLVDPITPFVIICCAIEFAKLEGNEEKSGTLLMKDSDVANALHEELTSRGWLVDDADAVEETNK